MATSCNKNQSILFVGYNYFDEFGDKDDVDQPTPYTHQPFTKLFCANAFSIYTDDSYTNIWSSGYNASGQCGVTSDSYTIKQLEPITAFKENEINIKKICVNTSGDAVFFISDENKLYGCGWLKGINNDQSVYTPKLMTGLKDVIDAKATSYLCIALCSSNNDILCQIIQNWSRLYSVPDDVTSVIIMFSKTTTIYSTTNSPGSGHPKNYELPNKNGWNEVEFFNDKNVIKIDAGYYHTLFLDDTGNVYACGKSASDGRLGIGDVTHLEDDDEELISSKVVNIPLKIKYFEDNGIRIVDIACGSDHNLALDVNGRIYSWGWNEHGQCGDGKMENEILEPKLIESLKGYRINLIRCGYCHSYCRSECGKHFIWGNNTYGGCMVKDEEMVLLPYRVDGLIKEQCGDCEIVELLPGYYNTKVIVEK